MAETIGEKLAQAHGLNFIERLEQNPFQFVI